MTDAAASKQRKGIPITPRRIAAACGVVAAALGLWALFSGAWSSPEGLTVTNAGGEPTYIVKRGPLTISFTEKGSVKAARSQQIYNTLEGTSTIVNIVPEGTFVEEGDVLVELDSSQLVLEINQQQIAVDTANADLIRANEAVEIQKSQNASDIKEQELAVAIAGIDLEKYKKGDWPLALASAKAAIKIAEEELRRAQNRYNWTDKLAKKGYVTGTELVADELAVSKATIQYEEAVRSLEVLENWTRSKDTMQYESVREQAERALERAKLQANAQMAQVLADQRGIQSKYELSKQRLEKLQDQLERTKIRAPQDGMVVYVTEGSRGRDDRVIEQGGTVRERQHLIDLPDLSVMAVTVSVPEARVHQIREGLRALVTIEAGSEVTLGATITKIGLLPDYANRWLNPDLKVYRTDLEIDQGSRTDILRPGMSARVEILIDNLRDAIYVPVQAVTSIDGEPVSYVLGRAGFEPRKLKLGLSNDSFVVVSEGLADGDLVQLNAPRPKGVVPKEESALAELAGSEAAGAAAGPVPASFRGGEGGRGGEGRRRDFGGGDAQNPEGAPRQSGGAGRRRDFGGGRDAQDPEGAPRQFGGADEGRGGRRRDFGGGDAQDPEGAPRQFGGGEGRGGRRRDFGGGDAQDPAGASRQSGDGRRARAGTDEPSAGAETP